MIKNKKDLDAIRDKKQKELCMRDTNNYSDYSIKVALATCGIAKGASETVTALLQELERQDIRNVKLFQTDCIGMCQYEPCVIITKDGEETFYGNVTKDKASLLITEHIMKDKVVNELLINE